MGTRFSNMGTTGNWIYFIGYKIIVIKPSQIIERVAKNAEPF